MIALGGWGDSAGNKYSRLVGDKASRTKFIENVITFIETHGFDGLDLDWEFPGCWQVSVKSYLTLLTFYHSLIEQFKNIVIYNNG